jgi:hypothetical protein
MGLPQGRRPSNSFTLKEITFGGTAFLECWIYNLVFKVEHAVYTTGGEFQTTLQQEMPSLENGRI